MAGGRSSAPWQVLTLGAWLISAAALGAQEAGGLDADVAVVLGQPARQKPAGAVVAAKAADLATKLRCPVCQGVAIADSPSGLAAKMRGQVRDLVAAGYSDEQVMTYFEHSYGESVRLEPPMRGINWMLWTMPIVVLVSGAAFVFRRARKPVDAASGPSAEMREAAPAARIDPELAKYVERIRRDSGTTS